MVNERNKNAKVNIVFETSTKGTLGVNKSSNRKRSSKATAKFSGARAKTYRVRGQERSSYSKTSTPYRQDTDQNVLRAAKMTKREYIKMYRVVLQREDDEIDNAIYTLQTIIDRQRR